MLDEYAIAQRSLYDALKALTSLSPKGFVLVGAHAVYLRTPHVELPIAPYTHDGDGLYELPNAPEEERYATRVDIFVPGRFSNQWDFEGFTMRSGRATMSQDGLELALRDYTKLRVPALTGDESIEIRVAGFVALTIAKAWKLGERHQKGSQAFDEVWKDVFDVYRLLRSSERADWREALARIPHESAFTETTERALAYLQQLFAGDAPALALIAPKLEPGVARDEILAALPPLVSDFCNEIGVWL